MYDFVGLFILDRCWIVYDYGDQCLYCPGALYYICRVGAFVSSTFVVEFSNNCECNSERFLVLSRDFICLCVRIGFCISVLFVSSLGSALSRELLKRLSDL